MFVVKQAVPMHRFGVWGTFSWRGVSRVAVTLTWLSRFLRA